MTIIEPTTDPDAAPTPRWQQDFERIGSLLFADEVSVKDPDYLIARLQRFLDQATEFVAHHRAAGDFESRVIADDMELRLLRSNLERFVSELRPFGRSGDEMLHTLERSHPDMLWTRTAVSFVGTPSWNGREGASERAAAALGLTEGGQIEGRRGWRGEVNGWPISIHEQ